MILGQEKLISAMLTTTSTGKRYIMATRPMDFLMNYLLKY